MGSRGRIIIELMLATVIALSFTTLISVDSAAAYPPRWTVQTVVENALNATAVSVDYWGSYIFIAFRTDTGAIYFQRSTDYGSTWEAPVCIDDGAFGTDGHIKIMEGCNSGNGPYIWIFYASKRDTGSDGWCEAWIARSDDRGATWPTDTSTDESTKPHRWHSGSTHWQYTLDADLLDGLNQIMVVCTEKRNDVWAEIKYLAYIDTGGTIHERSEKWVSSLNDDHSHNCKIACENNTDAVVVWSDRDPGDASHHSVQASWTDDKGATWNGPTEVAYATWADYAEVQIDWDKNNPTVLASTFNDSNRQWHISRFYWNEVYKSWRGNDGSNPPNESACLITTTGSPVQPHPAISGPWSYEMRVYENYEGGGTGQITLFDDQQEPAVTDCFNLFGALGSRGVSGCLAVEESAIVAAVGEDGKIYIRRKDKVAPPDVNLTGPPTGQAEPCYINGDFNVTSTAIDNYHITGQDISTGDQYCNGIRRVCYQWTENETDWYPLVCSDADEEFDGNYYSLTPPYKLTALAEPLKGKTIKIRACAEDSAGGSQVAGNIGYGQSPGWIVVDLEEPGTKVTATGKKGDHDFYVSKPSITITSSDPATAKIEYKLKDRVTGELDKYWSTYANPFKLSDGLWTIYHRATDKAGNIGTVKTTDIDVDTTPPVCAVLRPSLDYIQTGYETNETFRITGSTNDENGIQTGYIFVDGEEVYKTDKSVDNMAYPWPLSGVEDGNHLIEIKAKDMAGNIGGSKKVINIGEVATDWYFAEGNTLPEFDEYICIMNPGDKDTRVTITYMLDNGQTLNHQVTLPPYSRQTVNVKDHVPSGVTGLSTWVHASENAIVCERPMYFHYKANDPDYNWKGGHNCRGINAPQYEWYFAEGTTRFNATDGRFEEWLCLMNPCNDPANIEVNYQLGNGANIIKNYQLGPHSRRTVEVRSDVGYDQDVSAKVSADMPIVAERPQYFDYHGFAREGSNTMGATSPSTEWHFAEGCTRTGFQQWITVQNPNSEDVNVKATYMTSTGDVVETNQVVPARSRGTIDVLAQVGDNQDVSTSITSDLPIVAERPMYYLYGIDAGLGWDGGDDIMGNPAPSTTYYIAEGTTIHGFDTYFTLQNPNDDGAVATIQYCFPDGSTTDYDYYLKPHSRSTINVRDATQRFSDVSASVYCGQRILIERPMYFNYHGITGGHNGSGYGVD